MSDGATSLASGGQFDTTLTAQSKAQRFGSVALMIFALAALWLTSHLNYLLFHGIAELFSVAVAVAIFMLAWNARRLMDSDYLLFIGISYLFVAGVDTVHMMAYKGMGVFPGRGSNPATQLWIAAWYIESIPTGGCAHISDL